MPRNKYGNPKKRSRYICLNCLKMDGCMSGIQRIHGQREKFHIKDMWCIHCGKEIKALEVRYNDYLPEVMDMANKLHEKIMNGES